MQKKADIRIKELESKSAEDKKQSEAINSELEVLKDKVISKSNDYSKKEIEISKLKSDNEIISAKINKIEYAKNNRVESEFQTEDLKENELINKSPFSTGKIKSEEDLICRINAMGLKEFNRYEYRGQYLNFIQRELSKQVISKYINNPSEQQARYNVNTVIDRVENYNVQFNNLYELERTLGFR